jgi:hypothetical protein
MNKMGITQLVMLSVLCKTFEKKLEHTKNTSQTDLNVGLRNLFWTI